MFGVGYFTFFIFNSDQFYENRGISMVNTTLT